MATKSDCLEEETPTIAAIFRVAGSKMKRTLSREAEEQPIKKKSSNMSRLCCDCGANTMRCAVENSGIWLPTILATFFCGNRTKKSCSLLFMMEPAQKLFLFLCRAHRQQLRLEYPRFLEMPRRTS